MRDDLLALQRLLLPSTLPAVGCTEVAAEYLADNDEYHLGGDWYDLVDRPDDQVVAIVGDVVGHGVQQIGVMGQLRAASNALARSCAQPHEILRHLDAVSRDVPGAKMASVAVLMLDGSNTARIASAGHPPLVHVTPGGDVDVIEAGRRPPLAIAHGLTDTATFEYDVDDILVMFTDGLVERRGADLDERFERLGRLIHRLHDRPCREIAAALVDDAAPTQQDDMAVLVMRPRNHRAPDFLLVRQDAPSVNVR